MFVGDQMSAPVVTVKPDLPFQEALKLMRAQLQDYLPLIAILLNIILE